MKKFMVVAVLFVLIGTAAFAQFKIPELELSAGAGALLSGGRSKVEASAFGYSAEATLKYTGFGGYAFFDATFAEVGVGILGGKLKYETDFGGIGDDEKLTFTALDISLLGKWPFNFGKITVFPLLGIDYRAFLYVQDYENPKTGKKGNQSELNEFWFNLGAGLDYTLTDSLYLRGELLYGFRPNTKYEKDWEKALKPLKTDIAVGHGPTVKIAVGYKF
jgi:opacity protein-like surface antigen